MEQSELLRYVAIRRESLGIPYMLVGSFGSGIHGEPRQTNDIDLVIQLSLRQVEPFCQAFPAPDFYVSDRAVNDAIMQRIPFNVIHPSSGNKVDFMVPQTNEWSATQLQRRQRSRVFPDLDIWVAAPEDVILGKLWYFSEGGSDKHLRDILGILKISGDLVDRDEVSR